MEGWLKLVGSLRTNGYNGHIIVGVNPAIPQCERNYLDKMGVTYYAIETANCSASILENGAAVNARHTVRAKCSKGMEDLKLEWGRYEMAQRWLSACTSCTGWSMVIDTRDIFFQADPFLSLGDPKEATHDLLFVEEIAQYTNTMPETPHRALKIVFDDRSGLILNPHEKEGSLVRVAPTLHQWDRCGDWIRPWFREHKDLYARASTPRDEPGVKWV